jgi:PilJ/NarX-like methyl-accepting chemotaxis transducer
MQRRDFLVFSASAVLGSALVGKVGMAAPSPASPGLSPAAAVNKAGRQRMLSQRCAKAWLMVLANVEAERGRKILEGSIALFDRQMSELGTLQPNPDVAGAYGQLRTEWEAYRPLLAQAPSAAAAPAVFKANESVLVAAHKTTQAYEKTMGGSLGRVINLSGRQRMLSQRMAKFYLFQRLGVNAPEATAGLDKARKEFTSAQAELMAAPENTPAVRNELALAEQQWQFFQAALDQSAASAQTASHVATTSERILEELDLCVTLYEGLATKAA